MKLVSTVRKLRSSPALRSECRGAWHRNLKPWSRAKTSISGTITASAPKFRRYDLKLKKVAILAYATDEQLDFPTLFAVGREGFQAWPFANECAHVIHRATIRNVGTYVNAY